MGMKPTHREGQLYTDRTKQVISTDISSETMEDGKQWNTTINVRNDKLLMWNSVSSENNLQTQRQDEGIFKI